MNIRNNARLIAAAALCGLAIQGSVADAASATASNTVTGGNPYNTITVQARSGGITSTVTDEATFGSSNSAIGVPFTVSTFLRIGSRSETIGINISGQTVCNAVDTVAGSGTVFADCTSAPRRVNHNVD